MYLVLLKMKVPTADWGKLNSSNAVRRRSLVSIDTLILGSGKLLQVVAVHPMSSLLASVSASDGVLLSPAVSEPPLSCAYGCTSV